MDLSVYVGYYCCLFSRCQFVRFLMEFIRSYFGWVERRSSWAVSLVSFIYVIYSSKASSSTIAFITTGFSFSLGRFSAGAWLLLKESGRVILFPFNVILSQYEMGVSFADSACECTQRLIHVYRRFITYLIIFIV